MTSWQCDPSEVPVFGHEMVPRDYLVRKFCCVFIPIGFDFLMAKFISLIIVFIFSKYFFIWI